MSMNLKAVSAKSCEYNSNFYDYEVFTVNTNSSLQVRVKNDVEMMSRRTQAGRREK